MKYYDHIIVGAGAAGLHLALAMQRTGGWGDKKVLILDKNEKNENDRTWSFWEKGRGLWDSIVHHQWEKGLFHGPTKTIELNLEPYTYKTIQAIDFYHMAKTQLANDDRFDWITDNVVQIATQNEQVIVTGETEAYLGGQVFDSRIPAAFFNQQDDHIRLVQHFKGWVVKTKTPQFDPDCFLMMDYRMVYKDTTSFTYILPYSPTCALIEFTFFSKDLLEKEEYEGLIKTYIESYLDLGEYEVVEEEFGIIPMTTYPFHEHSSERILKIGTAGSWVKPSSGYSFKNAERNAQKIVNNIIRGKSPGKGLIKPKFRFYDRIFLDVLSRYNQRGPKIFQDMYGKNSTKRIFRFLDEETHFLQEVKIMSSFQTGPFMRAFFRQF